jgi:hypothetical protein
MPANPFVVTQFEKGIVQPGQAAEPAIETNQQDYRLLRRSSVAVGVSRQHTQTSIQMGSRVRQKEPEIYVDALCWRD